MRRCSKGLTLAELVLAMAITAVIGLAATGVTLAVSNINEEAESYYEYLQSGRVAASRLERTLRSARLVTVAEDSKIVAWTRDRVDKGNINVSEVTKIYLNTNTKRLMLRRTVFPDSMDQATREALDVSVPLSDLTDPSVVHAESMYPQYDVTRVLARNVWEFTVYPDEPAPLTGTLKFRLVVGSYPQTVTRYGAVTLRASKVSRVAVANGTYVLE